MKSILSSFIMLLVLQSASAQRKYNRADGDILSYEMVRVEGGTFDLGDDNDGPDRAPAHTVKLSDFLISTYEVKQAQWYDVMGSNPSVYCCDQCPVTNVSYNDVNEFIKKLNEKTSRHYRLPTEAEWEFAARGGKTENLVKPGKFVYRSEEDLLGGDRNTWKPERYKAGDKYAGRKGPQAIAWYEDNSRDFPHGVGRKQSNQLGIYDMSGNVEEWTSDWYANTYGTRDSVENPTGPIAGRSKVVRGGSYASPAVDLHVTRRAAYLPSTKSRTLGFRLVEDK
jgi:formylglycine-generating enzyme required for sulfatase activity